MAERAAGISPELINEVVERVVVRLKGGPCSCRGQQAGAPEVAEDSGSFKVLDDAVAAAREAQAALDAGGLDLRRVVVASIREVCLPEVERLARLAVEEAGYGRVEDKIFKNRLAVSKTPGCEVLRSRAVSGDHGLTLTERAPWGVIGSITPVTNPTETIICNSIGMIAAGNAVVFNPHPAAAKVSNLVVHLVNEASRRVGGPPDLATSTVSPTIESAQALMRHPEVNLLVVTGGPGVVKAALGSGKRAICAGPGNPPAVVDETADLAQAARDLVRGASLDNNIVCVVEKVIIVVEQVAGRLMALLEEAGARRLSPEELLRLTPLLFEGDPARHLPNRRMVGKNTEVILKAAGLACPPEARLAFAECPADHPLVLTEQLMPVLPLVRVRNVEEAIRLAVKVEGGRRHTAVMHSRDIASLSAMARACNASIFVKNGPSFAGLGLEGEDYCSFSIASPTGEGLTNATHFTRERRCTLKDYFRII
ncbi:MAG: aldehyde dehydrogenase family protein [Pseudomonadota bacterium]